MRAIFIFVLYAISASCFAEKVILSSPDKTESISYICTDDGCSAWIDTEIGKISLFNGIPTCTVRAKWHSTRLAEVSFSCGSPCNISFFYQKGNGVSKPTHDVLALDAQRYCVLKPTDDGKGIALAPIFYKGGAEYYWRARYSDPKFGFYTQSAVIFSTIKGNFQTVGRLKLSYLNKDGNNTAKLIDQKCPD
ncbi:hypothetical protein [Vogesella oryzae]|uniref:hypothetical protein n=1 Tax=Vogesella oryzae TaxID=1735285 RepID=UPI001581F5C5|nr:hypothetical protein [Vogesella oryzae]